MALTPNGLSLCLKDGNLRLELCEFVIVKGVILAKIEYLS